MLRLFRVVVGQPFWNMAGFVAIGVIVVLCCDQFSQAQDSAAKKSIDVESVVEAANGRDEPASKPLTDEDFAINADLVAACESLDESLKYEGKTTKGQQTRDRLVAIGLVGGTFLALLAVLFGYLRLDHATRGFYSGRLQLLAGISAVAILAVCYFLWTLVLFK